MREPGASAKPKPEPRPLEPGPPSTVMAPAVPPPRLSAERWVIGSDLPDFHDGVRRLPEHDRDIISRKMSSILQGWTNTRLDAPHVVFWEEDLSVDFEHFMNAMRRLYRTISVSKVADIVKFGNRSRSELFVTSDESLGLRIHHIDETDLRLNPPDGSGPAQPVGWETMVSRLSQS